MSAARGLVFHAIDWNRVAQKTFLALGTDFLSHYYDGHAAPFEKFHPELPATTPAAYLYFQHTPKRNTAQ
jgi:hypothetical protein